MQQIGHHKHVSPKNLLNIFKLVIVLANTLCLQPNTPAAYLPSLLTGIPMAYTYPKNI